MNKLIISALALAAAAPTFAYVEKNEVMTVEKADGTTQKFLINELDRVSFGVEETEYALYFAPAGASALKLVSVPSVFLANPASPGDPYEYGFSAVAAAEPAEARQGEYAVQVSVGELKMNESDVDLAGGATSGINVAVYHYTDGEVDNVWETQAAGSFTMSTNNKTQIVKFEIEATYADGSELYLTYSGKPTAVESMKGLNPPFEYVNQGQYFNADGNPETVFNVTAMKYTSGKRVQGVSYEGFEFTLDNGMECYLCVAEELVNAGTIDVADLSANQMQFKYGYNIQLASKGTQWSNCAQVGTFNIVDNGDGTYVIDFDMTNLYLNTYGSQGGSPERVVLNFNGAAN